MKFQFSSRALLCICLIASALFSCKKNDSTTANQTPKTPGAQLVTDGLVSPVALAEPPDGSKRIFIADQVGQIWIIGADGKKLTTPFIDIASKMVTVQPSYDERGLLGLAFSPDFKANGKFYLFYTAPPRAGGPQPGTSWDNLTRISEFKVSAADNNVADVSSERVLLEADHPYLNHNGGTIAFGPDGYLYISIGDGGNKDDVGNGHVSDWYAVNAGGNGQDIYANLMGNVLRIDVNGSPYNIPSDNPFVGTAAKQEIYAYGFRNPYRFSFDMGGTHQLILGDAGQSLYEEIDLVTKGGNYGWNVKEGSHCFSTDNDLVERTSCPEVDSAGKPLIDPVIELVNAANPKGGGVAVTIVGGNVYRGTAIPNWQGKYIFGIFSQDGNANAKIYAADIAPGGSWNYSQATLKEFPADLGQYLKSIGQDQSGEIYLLTSGQVGPQGSTGKVYKIIGE